MPVARFVSWLCRWRLLHDVLVNQTFGLTASACSSLDGAYLSLEHSCGWPAFRCAEALNKIAVIQIRITRQG